MLHPLIETFARHYPKQAETLAQLYDLGGLAPMDLFLYIDNLFGLVRASSIKNSLNSLLIYDSIEKLNRNLLDTNLAIENLTSMVQPKEKASTDEDIINRELPTSI